MNINTIDDPDWKDLEKELKTKGTLGFYLRSDNGMHAEHNGNSELFCASAFKGFVLAECLRQCENGQRNLLQTLTITDDVKSPGGEGDGKDWSHKDNGTRKHLQDALEAMIKHSDNTATDLVLNLIDPESVRKLIHELDLIDVVIPDSTRKFMHELFGLKYDVGWGEFQKLMKDADKNLKTNPFHAKQRMAAPAKSLVDFYSKAENLFKTNQYKEEFRRILSLPKASKQLKQSLSTGTLCDIYVKGGSLGIKNFVVVSSAGWAELHNNNSPHKIFFAFIANFETAKPDTDTDHIGATVKKFIGDKLAKVISDMLAGGLSPPINFRLTTN